MAGRLFLRRVCVQIGAGSSSKLAQNWCKKHLQYAHLYDIFYIENVERSPAGREVRSRKEGKDDDHELSQDDA
jgi:hypothetical protein